MSSEQNAFSIIQKANKAKRCGFYCDYNLRLDVSVNKYKCTIKVNFLYKYKVCLCISVYNDNFMIGDSAPSEKKEIRSCAPNIKHFCGGFMGLESVWKIITFLSPCNVALRRRNHTKFTQETQNNVPRNVQHCSSLNDHCEYTKNGPRLIQGEGLSFREMFNKLILP